MSAPHQALFMIGGGKPPAVVAHSNFASTVANTAAGSLAASLPTRVAGNLLLAICGYKQSTGTVTALTPSAGWTKIGEFIDNTRRGGAFFWRMATNNASDALTVTTTGGNSFIAIEMLHFTGAHTSAAPECTTFISSINPAALNPSFGSETSLYLAIAIAGGTSTLTSYPTNYSLYQANQAVTSAVANDNKIYRSGRNISGNEDPGTYSIGTIGFAVGATVAIRTAA